MFRARRRVVAVHVPRRIEIDQVCEEQLDAPGQVGESRSAGFPLLFALRPLRPRPGRVPLRGVRPLRSGPPLRLAAAPSPAPRSPLSSASTCRLASAASAASRSCAARASRAEAEASSYSTTRSGFCSAAPDDRSSHWCFAAGPMCCDGGLSRRRSSAFASPASRARASCVAWLSGVTSSDTPARTNAWFISAAHAWRVSSSHARGFVRSLFFAPPAAGSPPFGAARRNHDSAARATPSFTRSENTRCRCGLSATPAFFEWPA